MMDHAPQPVPAIDPLDLVIDLSFDDGITVIVDAIVIWAAVLVPQGTRTAAEPIRAYAQNSRMIRPDDLAHWSAQNYWNLLIGAVLHRFHILRILTGGAQGTTPLVACSYVERHQRCRSLVALAQRAALPGAIDLFADVVERWASLCNLDILRAAVQRAHHTPDATWTEKRYRTFIPYVIEDRLEG